MVLKDSSNRKGEKSGSQGKVDRFESILEALSEGLVVVGKKGGVRYANPAAQQTVLRLPAQLFGPSYDWSKNLDQLVEFEIENPGGESSIFQVKASEAHWNGEQVYLLSIFDISQQRSKEALLRQAVDEAETRASELEVMRFVAEQLNRAAMLEETIQAGLETVQSLSNAEAAWAILREEEGRVRLVVIDKRFNESQTENRFLTLPENCACLEKLIKGELSGPTFIPTCEWIREILPGKPLDSGHYSIPLISEGQTLGVLNLVIAKAPQMTGGELHLMETISGQLANAIQRARLLSRSNAVLSRDQTLNTVTRTISSALDLPTVLNSILQLAVELVNADAGALGILSSDEENLSFPFVINLDEEMSPPTMGRGGSDNLFWDVVLKGESILLDNPAHKMKNLPPGLTKGLSSVILAPIINGEKHMGLISLFSRSEGKHFSQFDVTLVESLGRQAGLAIENAQLYFEVQMLTTSDPLTGLNNQISFNNLGMKEVERAWRYNRPLTIMMLDIDRMKQVNEKYGEMAGDQVLKTVARCIVRALRRVDVLSRYTRDEFVLLLPETPLVNAKDVAERLRMRIADAIIEFGENTFSITASIGITSQENREEIDLQTLLDRAESAMQDAKESGGDKVRAWKPEPGF